MLFRLSLVNPQTNVTPLKQLYLKYIGGLIATLLIVFLSFMFDLNVIIFQDRTLCLI